MLLTNIWKRWQSAEEALRDTVKCESQTDKTNRQTDRQTDTMNPPQATPSSCPVAHLAEKTLLLLWLKPVISLDCPSTRTEFCTLSCLPNSLASDTQKTDGGTSTFTQNFDDCETQA